MCGNRLRIGSILSFSRKCASISPTSFASSLASAIRDGAIDRLGIGDSTITLSSEVAVSAIAS